MTEALECDGPLPVHRAGDRIVCIRSWDYGPPADPRRVYVVEDANETLRELHLVGVRGTYRMGDFAAVRS